METTKAAGNLMLWNQAPRARPRARACSLHRVHSIHGLLYGHRASFGRVELFWHSATSTFAYLTPVPCRKWPVSVPAVRSSWPVNAVQHGVVRWHSSALSTKPVVQVRPMPGFASLVLVRATYQLKRHARAALHMCKTGRLRRDSLCACVCVRICAPSRHVVSCCLKLS